MKTTDEIIASLSEPYDFNNVNKMAEDAWLFLTNGMMPEKATIGKAAFEHEVGVMIESARQVYAKKEAVEFADWYYGKVHLYINHLSFDKKYPEYMEDGKLKSTEKLYDIFLKSKNQPT